MPYNINKVAVQISETLEQARKQQAEREYALAMAIELYAKACARLEEWQALVEQTQDRPRRRRARPLIPADGVISDCKPYPPSESVPAGGYRVIAADSSHVDADRHRGAFCHLINIGRVMIQYGLEAAASLESEPTHCSDYLAPVDEQGDTLEAECIALEMRHLYNLADQHRPDLAIYDGTLYQTGSNLFGSEASPQRIQPYLDEYNRHLASFSELSVPVAGYVSGGRATYVVRALTDVLNSKPAMFDLSKGQAAELAQQFEHLTDVDLFSQILEPGERSLIFQPWVPMSDTDRRDSQMPVRGTENYFTYIMFDEVVRIEFPDWTLPQLGRIHELLISQCALGKGYPLAVDLAHQYAVLRNDDRESYFYLLGRYGLMRNTSAKARSKQGHGGNI